MFKPAIVTVRKGFTGCGWAPYRRRNIVLWLVSLFSKCNDKHVTQPGAGLSLPGTVCYLVEMGNLKHANLQNRRDSLFNFYDNNFDLVVNMGSAIHSLV